MCTYHHWQGGWDATLQCSAKCSPQYTSWTKQGKCMCTYHHWRGGEFVVHREGNLLFTRGEFVVHKEGRWCSLGETLLFTGRGCGVHWGDFVVHREGEVAFTGGEFVVHGEVEVVFTGESLLFIGRGSGVHWGRLCCSQGRGGGVHGHARRATAAGTAARPERHLQLYSRQRHRLPRRRHRGRCASV